MTARPPLVIGADGLPQQLQASDSLSTGGTAPSATSANVALPNGYILKAGQVTSTSGGVATVVFPTAFPTACISLTATVAPGTANALTNYSVAIVATSKTGFTLQVNDIVTALLVLTSAAGVSVSVHWQAIGY